MKEPHLAAASDALFERCWTPEHDQQLLVHGEWTASPLKCIANAFASRFAWIYIDCEIL